MGNTIIIKPATYTRLSALLFAEICTEAGLPPGVFNVVTGPGSMGSKLASHPQVDKIGFTGSTQIGQLLRRATAGTGKKLSLELGGKSPMVAFDSCDVDSLVESVVDAIWFNQGQVCSAGSRLLVQETIYDEVVYKIKQRMTKLRLGNALDKCIDMGAVVDVSQRKTVEAYVEAAKKEGADVYQMCACMPKTGCFYPPTLICNVTTTSIVVQEEIFGPVLAVQRFRTPKEAISLANQTRYGLGASVFTENISLGLEVALAIKAGSVWINGHNMFDAAAEFGGYRESGYGREGGKSAAFEYAKPTWMKRARPELTGAIEDFGKTLPGRPLNPSLGQHHSYDPASGPKLPPLVPAVDHTYKMYIGGAQARPDAPYMRPILAADGTVLAQAGEGNRKDIR